MIISLWESLLLTFAAIIHQYTQYTIDLKEVWVSHLLAGTSWGGGGGLQMHEEAFAGLVKDKGLKRSVL